MYTQCPDCEIAFRVTADVLKQAAGMVRCGNCSHAFNALAYLSEQMPQQQKRHETSVELPELKPEIIDTDGGLPKSISAAQSAALLKTLDELAGSNIRIEDTGVEWRVLDDDEAGTSATDDDYAGDDFDSGITNVDEYLDNNETPIDEFLTATPEVVDAPEIFAAATNETSAAIVDELRFDDNTPLPDDFDLDADAPPTPTPTRRANDMVEAEVEHAQDDSAADFSLSEPDEWMDILGEFQDLASDLATDPAPPLDASADDDAGEDEPLDMDAQFALQAEAMGIDITGVDAMEPDELDEPEVEPAALGKLDELDDLEDLDGLDELDELDESDNATEDELSEEIVFGSELPDDSEVENDDDFDLELDLDAEDQLDDDFETIDSSRDEEFDKEIEQLDLIVEEDEYMQEPIVEQHTIENELESEIAAREEDSDAPQDAFHISPMTEEEHTVNMMIDQDLMSLAIEDEDGFASTIVMSNKGADKKARAEDSDDDLVFGPAHDESYEVPGFETIIMEGEFVRSAFDAKKLEADAAASAKLAKIKRAGRAEQEERGSGPRYGMVAGLVLLLLVLAAQAIHQSREALATLPAFSSTVGQVYRALGQPVQPAWDITGWRFEATKGSAEGENEELTIYSRLGNKSDGPLPYPLIGISLTDRFEETIGSRVLDPAEYLPTDLDPRKLVPPGNTFNAVITIDSATANATGFKLNVCYRLSDGQLRCAIDDFK